MRYANIWHNGTSLIINLYFVDKLIFMNLPIIPNSYNKVIIAIGLLLFYFSVSDLSNSTLVVMHSTDPIDSMQNELFKSYAENMFLFNKVRQARHTLYKDSLLRNKDTSEVIDVTGMIYSINPTSLNDSLLAWTNQLNQSLLYYKILNDRYVNTLSIFNKNKPLYRMRPNIDFSFVYISVFLICAGLTLLVLDEAAKRRLKIRKLLTTLSPYRNCQSCGRQFNSVVVNGKNSDDTLNKGFCSDCYSNGVFTDENLTKEIALSQAINETKPDNKTKRRLAKRFAMLERWSENHYF
jgi:hypothetical protein